MARYNYKAKAHSEWAKAKKQGHQGCEICGRGKPLPRTGKPKKGQRLHAHHVYGVNHLAGVVLCPTCHKLVDTLAGPGRGVFLSTAKWRKLRKLVQQKIDGPQDCDGKDCKCQ